jgi:hypothetical protein
VKIALRINLFLLFLVAVFDPADRITQMKVPLFVGLWIIFLLYLLFSREKTAPVSAALLSYIFVFSMFLPLISILWYFVQGGHVGPYDGFQYLKAFLFLTLAVILVVTKIDAIRPLSIVLTILSLVIIVIATLTYNDPSVAQLLWPIGDTTGMFAIGDRSYANLSYTYVYFHAAPLLILSLGYFTYRAAESRSRTRYVNAALLLLNIIGMIVSGTRNDMIFGVVTPLLVLLWYLGKNRKVVLVVVILTSVLTVGLYGGDIIRAMFDPENESNAIKLSHLADYSLLFSDPKTLLFGQGLGSYFYSTAFGTETSITELTYLEFIRNFGLLLAMIYYCLLVYPLIRLRDQSMSSEHYLFISYLSYLIMCISNPLLISSTGMLVLAIVISKMFPIGEKMPARISAELWMGSEPAG